MINKLVASIAKASQPADLIRSANEQGLLKGDWPAWRGYRDMYSKGIETYKDDIAHQVVGITPAFLSEAEFLASKLKQPPSSF